MSKNKEEESEDSLERESDEIRRELHALRAQLEGIQHDVFATMSTVVSPLVVPVRLDKDIAKRLWERLDSEPGITTIVCYDRSEQVDLYRKFEDFSEIADDSDKDILFVGFRKEGKQSSPIRVDYNVKGVGRAKVQVFGKQDDATSLRDDLVGIVSRGREGSRWLSFSRWASYIGSVLICWSLLLFGVTSIAVENGEWTTTTAETLNVGMVTGAISFALGLAFGKFIVRGIGWLWPMVTIELGRGVHLAERRKFLQRCVIGSLVGALVTLGVGWLVGALVSA